MPIYDAEGTPFARIELSSEESAPIEFRAEAPSSRRGAAGALSLRAPALFGVLATKDEPGNLNVYYTDSVTNSLNVLK